jgi:hypothetical protein
MLTEHVISLLVLPRRMCEPVQPIFSLYTLTSLGIGSSNVSAMSEPLQVFNAVAISRRAFSFRTSAIALRTAAARAAIGIACDYNVSLE